MRILVVEDEHKVAQAVQSGFEREGYEVTVAATGEDAFFLAQSEAFDLIILDRMLPGRDGLQIVSTLRTRSILTPVIMLTAKDALDDRVAGLDAGADDYLVKPFAFAELAARSRALLRRGRLDNSRSLKFADLEMDLASHCVTRAGQALHLTVREFKLLEVLLRNLGSVVPRELLVREVWKESGRTESLDNVIDVHVARLRKKLDDPFPVKLLHTVRGLGFHLEERTE
jgi:two-component system copper resistance phosphate regulon response regulator CusR